jgi:phosphohistidine phosphatase
MRDNVPFAGKMEIYLFRHGIAEDGRPGRSDSVRELTEEGRKKVAEVVRLARKSGIQPTMILTSPYVRARQTAEIAAQELEYKEELFSTEALVPHSSPQEVWNEIRDHANQAALLLASHEPLLGHTVAYLLNAPSLMVEMKKAAMVRIDVESLRAAPHGILRWMIVPKMA